MLDITIEFDQAAFDATADSFVSAEVLSAMRDAVNYTAEKVHIRLKQEMLTVFDKPTPFTLAGLRVYRARPHDPGEPSAMVFLMDQQAAYFSLEITGDTRRAGDYATTQLGPLVPGPAAAKDRFGNLPRGFVAGALQDPAVAWVTLGKGEPPVLVRHAGWESPSRHLAVVCQTTSRRRWITGIDGPLRERHRPTLPALSCAAPPLSVRPEADDGFGGGIP